MTALPLSVEAVVVGSGPNGLVSSAILADAGWSVLLLEAQDELGGAVKSRRVDDWTMDRFSACHPLAIASPVLRDLELEWHGLRWARSDTVLAHPLSGEDAVAAVIHRDRQVTAANLADEHPSDGDAWLDLCAQYDGIKASFLDAMLTSWPPVNAARKLARQLGGTPELLRFARFLALPAYRMGEELFRGKRGRALLGGNAMHADAPADAPVSGVMGWLLAMLAQDVGFPSPVGGAGELTAALASRARSAGAVLQAGEPVSGIEVSCGTAKAVHTASGQTIRATKAIVCDVAATALYCQLLSATDLPSTLRDDLDSFEWDLPTVKVNYRLRSTPGWTAEHARTAGVIHLGCDADELVHWSAALNTRRKPVTPFALVGQMSTIDPTRSPPGTQALWAYSHLPRGIIGEAAAHELAQEIDQLLDSYAPGFADLIIDREVQTPTMMVGENANLVNGAIGGGTAQLFQQLVFRPVPGLGGARTVIDNLYLGSAAIHPGGGVHGACGALAARAALQDHGRVGGLKRRAASLLLDRFYRERALTGSTRSAR